MYNHNEFTKIANLALSRLKTIRLLHEDIEDIKQEMLLMGYQIKDRIDINKNWEGYVYISMLGAGLNYINSNILHNTVSISDVNSIGEAVSTEAEDTQSLAFKEKLVEDLLILDYKGWASRHFGLDGMPAESYRDIAATEEVSHSCVHNYVTDLLQHLRSIYEPK